ncbi:MAG: PAS domain S-box protein [Candidatus Sedimenticola sp. (ex Thyasira tokunagai)]
MAVHLIKSRVARRLVLSVLLVSFLVTLATTAFQLRNDYVASIEQIESDFQFIGSNALDSLVESAWVNDGIQVQLQLEGLANLPEMEHLVILVDGQVAWEAGVQTSDEVLSVSFPLLRSYRNQQITLGELKVTAGLEKLYERLWKNAGKILLTNTIEIFLVAGLLLFLFHLRVSQPLNRISAYLGDLDLDREDMPPLETIASSAPDRKDEFDQVGDVINAMTEKLSAAHRELEGKVQERTKRLRESESFLNDTGRVAKVGGWELDVKTKEVHWTRETYRIHELPEGYEPHLEEAINFYPPGEREGLTSALQQAADKGIPFDTELRFITAKNRHLWTRVICEPERVNGKAVKLRGTFQDITERKKMEERATRFGRIVERSLNEVFIFDTKELNFIQVNQGARTNLGYEMEELRNMTPLDIKPEFSSERFEKEIQPLRSGEREVIVFETVHKRKNGTTYDVEVHLQLMRDETPPVFVAIIQDITERKHMHNLIMQTEKMMTVGGLAAGMAHELNNPLGGMLQGIQNIQRRLSPDLEKNRVVAQELGLDLEKICLYLDQREIEKFMQGIRESGERAAEIVQNMLQFARKAESGLRPERLDLLVDRALELAAVDYDLKKKYDFREIEIIRQYDTTLAPVRCIASEIQQVLLNLLRNAAQALYKGEGKTEHPRITVRTYSQKGMACIKVEDNGPGMDEETRNHVFDPFFTTRPVGEGTGLGLSVSYFIVTQEHNGRMSVDSQPGLGAAFMVCLPMTS